MAETIIPSSKSNKRVKKSASPSLPPVDGACHFYIPKKNRYCKMVPAKDQRFCGEHIMSETKAEVPSKKLRIPCPIDPSHTCFQTQLQKHLKICNARLEDQPPGLLAALSVDCLLGVGKEPGIGVWGGRGNWGW